MLQLVRSCLKTCDACLQELDEPEYGHLFVKRAVTRALDKHNHEREMSSILLSALYGEVRSHAKGACAVSHVL